MFGTSTPRAMHRFRMALVTLGLLASALPAHAVPSFARQTGQDCVACHVGGFGPQLTPYGIKFKLGGYTDSDGKAGHIPLSAMLVQSYTQTSKDQSADPAKGFSKNDNLSLQEISMFVAGRFSDNIGAFVQVTHAEPDRKTTLDNADLRIVKNMQIADKDTVLGISINNNPTVQDAFNTVPAWRFPYMSSELAVGSAASPLIDGALAQQVIGVSAYGFYDNHWYAELGGYNSLSKRILDDINIAPGDKIKGTSPYWRLAYFEDQRKQAYSFGIFGMDAHLLPGWTPGQTDKYRDIGIDGSYQFLGTREHVFALNGSYINERRNLDASFGAGDAEKRHGSINRLDVSGSYHFDKTYGATLALFDIRGSRDNGLYNSGEQDVGSVKASPNTRGYTVQGDWTPFGKEDSWGNGWANLRLGLQYTGYTKFNGAKNNYDGFGRNASDNNTLFAFAWFAI
ncbi:probable potassium transport system protein kup [Novimethylophilus kurashikiensis]|uniref:Probable potassium transport system protein kup n=2 Tax=Novimethylophilus kurashikiensis TaxID=1825523 RepID=A0A2R5F8T6_9PROT|nr:probable potassium transport system protein kup [Novimethylophilus kurashikiensis]